jgi:valyl-tRNA synthetase
MSAKQTLYTALEGALTMIHPYMPFITEDLWQRLPRRPGDETPSIVKAAYPQYDERLDDAAAEAAYELVLDVSKGVRSLMSEYSIRENGKGVFLWNQFLPFPHHFVYQIPPATQ